MFKMDFSDLKEIFQSDLWRTFLDLPGVYRVVLFIFTMVAIIYVLSVVLERIAAIVERLRQMGFDIVPNEEARRAALRRHNFLGIVKSDLIQIGKGEAWRDQNFTDLEAEVEMEGEYYSSNLHKILGKKSAGVRKYKSLMGAIETSIDRLLLLVGAPGSGKSIALRHLAVVLVDEALRSNKGSSFIPIYVNLKEFTRSDDSDISADSIKAFVLENIRRGDSDTSQYVRESWDEFKEKGAFIFLLDSFDEIPDVLHAASGSDAVGRYSDAVYRFMTSVYPCRGVVASREYKGPQSISWPKIRILPLSDAKKNELIHNYDLSNDQRDKVKKYVFGEQSKFFDNPLLLSLVCRYVSRLSAVPENSFSLLFQHVSGLASRDSERLVRIYGLRHEELLECARNLAFIVGCSSDLSLAPTFEELEKLDFGVKGVDKEKVLQALIDCKIGRCDVREAVAGERRFSFSHRRYQEALFVSYLLKDGVELPAREFLTNDKWRDYAVTYLQSAPAEKLDFVIEEARDLVNGFSISSEEVVNASPLPLISKEAAHILTLLQEGLRYRIELDLSELQSDVADLISSLWSRGNIYERYRILGVSGMSGDNELTLHISEGIASGIPEFEDEAFRMVPYMRNIDESLKSWVLRRVSDLIVTAESTPKLISALSLISWLESVEGLAGVVERSKGVRKAFILCDQAVEIVDYVIPYVFRRLGVHSLPAADGGVFQGRGGFWNLNALVILLSSYVGLGSFFCATIFAFGYFGVGFGDYNVSNVGGKSSTLIVAFLSALIFFIWLWFVGLILARADAVPKSLFERIASLAKDVISKSFWTRYVELGAFFFAGIVLFLPFSIARYFWGGQIASLVLFSWMGLIIFAGFYFSRKERKRVDRLLSSQLSEGGWIKLIRDDDPYEVALPALLRLIDSGVSGAFAVRILNALYEQDGLPTSQRSRLSRVYSAIFVRLDDERDGVF